MGEGIKAEGVRMLYHPLIPSACTPLDFAGRSLELPARTRLTVRLGMSHETRNLYHRGEVDPAVIRRDQGAGDGETLGRDDLDWYGDVPEGSSGEALPLVLLPPPCGVREAAIAAMEAACLPWREAFTGGKLLALAAAVHAGAGVAPLGRLTARELRHAALRWGSSVAERRLTHRPFRRTERLWRSATTVASNRPGCLPLGPEP